MSLGQHQGPYLGSELERLKSWLESPQRLLRVVTGTAAAHAGPLHRNSVETRLEEEDVITLVRLLAHVALVSRQVKSDQEAAVLAGFFRQRLGNLPVDLVVTLERALGQMPASAPSEPPLPVQVAATLSERLALEAYQRAHLMLLRINHSEFQ